MEEPSSLAVATTVTKPHSYGELRQDWLDWLRGLAVLLVLATHYQMNWREAGLFVPLAAAGMRIGWSGVDLFFVISGFLVGGLLLSEQAKYGHISFRRFYARRILKIWPLLYLMPVAFLVFTAVTGYQRGAGLAQLLPIYFHIQNYYPPAVTGVGHLWSLAVEEHFYLLLPLLLTLIGGIGTRRVPAVLLALILAIVAWRMFAVMNWHPDPQRVRVLSHYRMDGLLFGVLLGWLYRYRHAAWEAVAHCRGAVLCAMIACAWPFAFNANHSAVVAGPGFTSIYLMYGCLLMLAYSYSAKAVGRGVLGDGLRAMAWVGRYSFPIYLFHSLIWLIVPASGFDSMAPLPPLLGSVSLSWLLGFLVFIGVSVGVGAAVGALVERPLLVLRNRLVRPRVAPLPGQRLVAEEDAGLPGKPEARSTRSGETVHQPFDQRAGADN